MNRFVDLHVHTYYSDGSFSPEDVVTHAKRLGFAAIGIADHDEVGAVSQAIWLGHSHGIEIIPAVELTSACNGKEIHLLGYLIDHNNTDLRETLKHLRSERFKRMERMVDKLRKLGVDIYIEAVRRVAGSKGSIGRLHLARALFDRGQVTCVQEAFDRYIGKGKPAYSDKPRLKAAEAIELITGAGGIAVLAHPKLVHIDEHIPELVHIGLKGIEAFYSKHTSDETARYVAVAEQLNLLVTGGSDCHGVIKDKMLLGSVKLPYRYLTILRDRVNGNRTV
ncbi:MAG: PHP domain-containing protein [Candidatus Abyssobacteria bacterium SURF_5]|uniref:PHP domain-containing protein n=1 Tax=Abyssobacteria bacterium (strain SURF_5) TaxID=2093360 RepID=A0A3A4N8K3_ABYX5|nr:MAG: PHP domain-containing protein [Candidatus Abyssubacteria bacterium SURF_5]